MIPKWFFLQRIAEIERPCDVPDDRYLTGIDTALIAESEIPKFESSRDSNSVKTMFDRHMMHMLAGNGVNLALSTTLHHSDVFQDSSFPFAP